MNHAITIFTAELKYQWELLTMAVVMMAVSATASAFFVEEWLLMMLAVGQIAYIIGAISIGSRMDSEKRERTARLLPLRPIAFGVIRTLVFVTYCLMIMAIILVTGLISGAESLSLADLFTLFGFNLVITAVIFINDDVYFIWGWRARALLWLLVILIVTYSVLSTGGMALTFSSSNPKSYLDAALSNAIWLVLMGMDVWFYTKRREFYK